MPRFVPVQWLLFVVHMLTPKKRKMVMKKRPVPSLHHVSKNCANLFLSELHRISTNFHNFWQKDGKEAKIMHNALIFHLT